MKVFFQKTLHAFGLSYEASALSSWRYSNKIIKSHISGATSLKCYLGRELFEPIMIIVWFLCKLDFTFFHVMYAFQSESTPYSCLNVKELLAQSRHKIWRWSDCNWTQTQNQNKYLGLSSVAVISNPCLQKIWLYVINYI